MTLGELRVHGVLGGQGADGMVFEVLPNYLFLNPEDYFNFVYKNNTNFAELKLQLDRDVSRGTMTPGSHPCHLLLLLCFLKSMCT